MTLRARGPTVVLMALAAGCSSSNDYSGWEEDVEGGTDAAPGTAGSGGSVRKDGAAGTTGGSVAQKSDASYSTKITPSDPGSWQDATNNLGGITSECDMAVGISPLVDMVVASVGKHGVWASADGGDSWQEIGLAGDKITSRASMVVFDPVNPGVIWQSGTYSPAPDYEGVYKSIDNGDTFIAQGVASYIDSLSIDWNDPQRKTMLAGPHEASQKLFKSTDGGAVWDDWGSLLPAGTGQCTQALVIDAQTFLVGCGGWGGGTLGIQRTVNGGSDWTTVYSKGAMASQALLASDGTIYWALGSGGLVKSADKGATWTDTADAAIAGPIRPAEMPDGRLVTAVKGSSATTVSVSSDKGATWSQVTTMSSFEVKGIAYSKFRQAVYVWRWDCGTTVWNDWIQRYGYP